MTDRIARAMARTLRIQDRVTFPLRQRSGKQAGHHHRDVVAAPVPQCRIDQRGARLFSRVCLRRQLGNLGIGEVLSKPVGAEQQRVTGLEVQGRDLGPDRALLVAHRLGQHVAQRRPFGRRSGEQALVNHFLGHGLVLGDLRDDGRAEVVAAAVADLDDVGPRPEHEDHGERGGHPLQAGAPRRLASHSGVAPLHRKRQVVQERVLTLSIQVGEEERRAGDVPYDRVKRSAARHLATLAATHAVGDEEQQRARTPGESQPALDWDAGLLDLDDSPQSRDEVLVLIPLPDFANIGRAGGVDARVLED